jgi:hypothetical protein
VAVFQHTNIRTPQLLGYIVQRPESHSVHHARFYDGASAKMPQILVFKDIAGPDFDPAMRLGRD